MNVPIYANLTLPNLPEVETSDLNSRQSQCVPLLLMGL